MYPTIMLDPVPHAVTYGASIGPLSGLALVALMILAVATHPSFRSAFVALVSGLRRNRTRMVPAASHHGSY